MVFQISYDLKSATADYSTLYEKIKEIGDTLPMLKSTWLVCSTLNSEQITDLLSPLLQQGDHLLVSEIMLGKYNGWHTKSTWTWIHEHLRSGT